MGKAFTGDEYLDFSVRNLTNDNAAMVDGNSVSIVLCLEHDDTYFVTVNIANHCFKYLSVPGS